MTLLATPIIARSTTGAIADVRRAVNLGADAVEFRLDHMIDVDLAAAMNEVPASMKIIATARDPQEGGVLPIDDLRRIDMLAAAAALRPDYIDIELATWLRCGEARTRLGPLLRGEPRRAGQDRACRLILSSHDFAGRPPRLNDLLTDLEAQPCDVVKIVWQAASACDVFAASDLMRTARKPAIVIAMGEAGVASRILARKLGAFLSFWSLDEAATSAPGQMTLRSATHLYHWDRITPTTIVYGVIGCPIMHSMSPAIHNAAMLDRGMDAVYLPFRVEPGYEPFDHFVRGFLERPWLDLRGLSVTIPHKENALRLVGDRVEPLARQIGAVNTLVFEKPDAPRGLNTDYAGALDALTDAMGCSRGDLRGLPVAVLGAGGAGRGIVAGLRDCGCRVTIYNRTYERARTLAEEFGCRAEPMENLSRLGARIVVNTSSVGMLPDIHSTPLPAQQLTSDMVVFDNVYNPIETRLLREAAAAGCRTVSGVDMFVNQAVAQFQAWTHQTAPKELMRRVVLEELTSRRSPHEHPRSERQS